MHHRYPSFGRPRAMLPRVAAATILATVIAMAFAPAAPAQTACLDHDKLAELLDGRYAEKPVALGLESGGRLFEVFAAADGTTWTMVITTPEGASCVVAVGEDWQTPEKVAYEPEM